MYALCRDGGRAPICSVPDPPQGQGGGAGGQQAGGPGGHEGDPRRGPVQQQPAQQVGEGGGDPDPAVEAAEHPPLQGRGRDPLDQGGGGHVHGGDPEPAHGLHGEGGRDRPGQSGEQVAGAADGEAGQQQPGRRRGGPGDRRGGPPVDRGGPGDRRGGPPVDRGGPAAYVDADNRGGARQAVDHLAQRGRRRIATIAGPQDMGVG